MTTIKQHNYNETKKKICVYSGSFNPVHNGHIALAEYLVDRQIVDEVWVVISPQNPLKPASELIDDTLRLQMAKMAFDGKSGIKVSDVEFYLPKPSYTIDTLDFLQSQYSEFDFCLLIGEDNIVSFHKWKNSEDILRKYPVIVYPRHTADHNSEHNKSRYRSMQFIDAPAINISSTDIRNKIKQNLSIVGLLPQNVIDFIYQHRLYKL